jgi:type IV pilus assembly protein PilN
MRITLNLATRPYANLGPALKRLRIAMAVLAVAAIGLGFGLRAIDQQAEEARATEDRVQKKIDAVNRERQGYISRMREPSNAQLLTQVGTLNQLFDEKTFSWTLAMEDLETVLPGGVMVTSIDPSRDPKTGRITLKMRVVGPRDHADDLVENLEHSKHFLLPHIVDESTDSNTSGNQHLEPVSASNRFTFEILADYNPAAPEEVRKPKAPEEKPEEMKVQPGPKPQPKPLAKPQDLVRPALPAMTNPPVPMVPRAQAPLPPSAVQPIPNAPGAMRAPMGPNGPLQRRPGMPPGPPPNPNPNPNAGGPQ